MSSSTGVATGAPVTAEVLVAAIGAALDQLGAQVLDGTVGDSALAASVEGLHKVETRVRAEKLRRIAEVDRRKAYASQGSRSTPDLLARRLGLTRGEARRETDTATGLERLPQTAERFRRGELGSGQADTAARMAEELPFDDDAGDGDPTGDAGAGSDSGGNDSAGGDSGNGGAGAGGGSARERFDAFVAREGGQKNRNQLRQRINEWQHDQDPDWLADRDRALHAQRRASVRTDDGGAVRLDARFDPLGGSRVTAALDALSRPADGNDARSLEQRRADALVELADRYLADADRPDVTASRPQVLLLQPVPTGDEAAPPATLDGYGLVSAATAAQAGCDAETTTVTIDRNGDVLDVGRARRQPSTRQRAAVIARDRQCIGCGAPISRCDIHHVRPWAQGGPTDLSNLVAVCWSCHHHLHHHSWQVTRDPDGSYELRTPEPARDRQAAEQLFPDPARRAS